MVCVFVYCCQKYILQQKTTFNTFNNVEKVRITKFILEEKKLVILIIYPWNVLINYEILG